MTTERKPLDWFIEVCRICGCQLGPGVGSRTQTGRCIHPEHGHAGGVVVRVMGRPPHEQEVQAKKVAERLPNMFLSGYYHTDGEETRPA